MKPCEFSGVSCFPPAERCFPEMVFACALLNRLVFNARYDSCEICNGAWYTNTWSWETSEVVCMVANQLLPSPALKVEIL